MRVLILSAGQDTGGQGYRIKRALDRWAPGWSARSMHSSETFLKYPSDLKWDWTEAQRLYDEADVVHHKNGVFAYSRLDGDRRKPTVVHHQGSRLRTNPREVSGEAKSIGAVQLVSTVDLLDDAPGSTWLPTPYPLAEIREKYRVPRPNRKVRIGHAPTNRQAKASDEILAALDKLSRWHDIEVDLIENVEWRVCLSRKAKCDIFIDQLTLGMGNNAVEAFALGIPVVSGFAEPRDRELFIEQTGTEPPFYEATLRNLGERLEHLILSPDLRQEWGQKGYDYAVAYHEESQVVKRLIPIYENAKPTRGTKFLRRWDPRTVQATAKIGQVA